MTAAHAGPEVSTAADPSDGTKSAAPYGPVEKTIWDAAFHPRWRSMDAATDRVAANARASIMSNARV
jgi:hypothetical protein